jgi:hypothetical protein
MSLKDNGQGLTSVLNLVVNNVLMLAVDILNICDFKCEKYNNSISICMPIMNMQFVYMYFGAMKIRKKFNTPLPLLIK